jgi:hypothetical protein
LTSRRKLPIVGLRSDLRLIFAYAVAVSSTCRVSFTDGADVTDPVTVSAIVAL